MTHVLTPNQIQQIPSRTLPISLQLNYILQEFTTLSLSLFALLSSSYPSSSNNINSSTNILRNLAELDKKLASILSLTAEHINKQAQINQLESSLSSTSLAWSKGTSVLHNSIEGLKPLLNSGKLDEDSILLAKKSNHLNPDLLLSYAKLLAPFTSAPPSSLLPSSLKLGGGTGGITTDPSGRSLPIGAFPPFPTEGQMRSGRLQFGKEVGVLGGTGGGGEEEEVGGE